MKLKSRPILFTLALVLLAMAFGASTVVAQQGSGAPGMMGNHDKRFIEMMVPHHQDAIEMAQEALQFAQHQELVPFAQNIINVQSAENQQMRTWYRQWFGRELPVTTPDPYTWQGDEQFLREMITHHQMGVHMAQMEVRMGRRPPLRDLARDMMTVQTAEIAQMRTWLQEWYPQPIDAPPAMPQRMQRHACR